MIRSLYTSVSGLIALENKQNVITNNMTNANTVGFKADNLALKSFEEVYIQNKDNLTGTNKRIGTLSMGTKIDEINTYFTQGLIKDTKSPTDFAIDGRGFFTVERQTATGTERYYTRDGKFKVDVDGYLKTTNGENVLGINRLTGEMEPIRVNNTNFIVDKDNNVFVNGISTHSLAMADFEDYSSLVKIGDNNYIGGNPIYNSKVWVYQGATEGSNVNVANEMVDMMTNMRNFESNQKMIQIIDETLGKAANEIGRL